jgi:hypothetical protein
MNDKNSKDNPYQYNPLPNERIVWQDQRWVGIIHRKVVTLYILTNIRAIANEKTVLIKDVDNIVVMNSRRVSSSNRYGSYGYRSGYSTGRVLGNTIGDLLFMSKGVVRVSFRNVNDPRGLLQLAKAVKDALVQKAAKVKSTPSVSTSSPNVANTSSIKPPINKGQVIQQQGISKSQIECPKCHSVSPFGSNFCTRCGFMLK